MEISPEVSLLLRMMNRNRMQNILAQRQALMKKDTLMKNLESTLPRIPLKKYRMMCMTLMRRAKGNKYTDNIA